MHREYNPNPENITVGDCVVRALTKVFHSSWEEIYTNLAVEGLLMHDMPSANRVWKRFLHEHGFTRTEIANSCPDCYTVRDFCEDHPEGIFILSTGTHVIAVENGDYWDAWDSGSTVPTEYWSMNV